MGSGVRLRGGREMGAKELVVESAASFDSVARCERPRDSRCSARLRAWRMRAWHGWGIGSRGGVGRGEWRMDRGGQGDSGRWVSGQIDEMPGVRRGACVASAWVLGAAGRHAARTSISRKEKTGGRVLRRGADLVEVLLQGQEIIPIRLPLWRHALAPRCVPAGCPRHGSSWRVNTRGGEFEGSSSNRFF